VKEETLLGYQKHLTPFLAFLQNRWELAVLSAEDVDLLMLEYRTEFDITRSQHTQLVASMEFFMPHVKGKLLLNREAIKGRIAGAPIQHTVPLTRECAFLFAAWHSSRGFPRLGAAVLIQMNTGLRPSEMLSLVREHVYIPLNPREAISVRLGAVYSTKVKREQFVLVQPSQSPFEYKLIKLLHAATLPNNKLFPFSYAAYNNSFGLAEKHFGLDLHLTAHSGRAGFATSRIMSGAEAKQVQAEGRWASESSFRTYIDVVGSLHTRAQVELGRLQAAATWCEQHIEDYFAGLALVNGTSAKQGRQCGTYEAPRLEAEGESLPHSSGARALHRVSKATVARGAVAEASEPAASSRQRLRTKSFPNTAKGKGSGKGRGKLLAAGRPSQSVFD